MTTQSVSRPAATSRGGGTTGQGSKVNDGVNGVPDFSTIIAQHLQMLLPTSGDVSSGCTYKEFLACNPKEYDGKRGAIVYTRWIEKIESVKDISGCRDSQKMKYTTGSFGNARNFIDNNNHTGCTYKEFLACNPKEYDVMVVATEPITIQKAVPIAGTLTNEAIRNGSIKKNTEKRGNRVEPSKDRNRRNDNKRTRTGNAFATTTNHVKRGNTGMAPKCTTCNFYHPPETPYCTCFNWNRPGHLVKDYRVVCRNVNLVSARNPAADRRYWHIDWVLNQTYGLTNIIVVVFEYHFQVKLMIVNIMGRGNQGNQARDIEPNDLGFSFEIEIASGQLVEIDKVIKCCKLEIEGHVFDINLIPFRSVSFDVIIGMDWLFDHKAKIICHEKVIVQLILFIVDSGCTKHMTGNLKLLCNFVEKYMGTVCFDNDQFALILGYGDLVQGNITINRVYYVEGLSYNLFSVVSKSKRSSFKTKVVPSSKGPLNLLHMDLCGPMRVASINGKKYILVIVDDYFRYTWTLFLRSKDETPEVLKYFLIMIQQNLQAPLISVRTDRGTEFLNKTLYAFFKKEGTEHQTSTPRTPEQNGVVER
nr:ribonuclease H-like domain-containing protein [Tanacetum cinerariifolium]